MIYGLCVAGVMTAHMLMPAVLENRPERVCTDCDGYIGAVKCQDMGKRYSLFVEGKRFRVAVADCATWAVGRWPYKAGQPWLGDIAPLPGLPPLSKPTQVLLCPL